MIRPKTRLISERIYQASSKLLLKLKAEHTYAAIVAEAMKLTNARYGSIFIPVNGKIERIYASDPRLYNISVRRYGKTYTAYKQNKPYILNSKQLEDIHPEFEDFAVGSDLTVPLSYNEKTIGVLSVISDNSHCFTKKDLRQLQYFSPIATLAINNVFAYERIQSALEERDLFISMASHELRTPLTSTVIYAQLLEKKLKEKKLIEETSYAKKLLTSVKRLQELTSELLQISQIKTGALKFQKDTMDLGTLLLAIVKEAQNKHPGNIFQITNSVPGVKAIICADETKIEQVFNNLINNSVKYSSENSKVNISLEEENGLYSVKVSDEGKGIPKKELPYIFNRFYRGTGSKASSLGLGLYIVKVITDKHRGKIEVSSEVGKGTTFSISFKKFE